MGSKAVSRPVRSILLSIKQIPRTLKTTRARIYALQNLSKRAEKTLLWIDLHAISTHIDINHGSIAFELIDCLIDLANLMPYSNISENIPASQYLSVPLYLLALGGAMISLLV